MDPMAAIDFRCCFWTDMISTGIDPRRLRNALDRGILKVGAKRDGKIAFTLRERFVVAVFGSLTSLWVPVSIASKIATEVAPLFENLLDIGESWETLLLAWEKNGVAETRIVKRSELPGITGCIMISLSVIAGAQVAWIGKLYDGCDNDEAVKERSREHVEAGLAR